MPIALSSPSELDALARSDIRALAARVEAEDGQPPLSDQAISQLTSRLVQHTIARRGDELVGYAQLAGGSLEIAASGEALAPLLEVSARRPVLVWTHGTRSRLAPMLEANGFERARVLHQLCRSLADPIESSATPLHIDVRPFVVGRDEDEWLRVNSAAFAEHREQAGWTLADLQAREAEAWFDPAGFLLAWHGGELAGFHWTKIHPDGAGEVYVLGVAPSAQGTGLGKFLLLQGLAWLRARGCQQALLYVDDSNSTAMRLYERSGFERHDVDVQWERR